MRRSTLLTVILIVTVVSLTVMAEMFTDRVSYQGRLTDSGGIPVAPGSYTVTFMIFKDSSAGIAVWEESPTVNVDINGLFSIDLGGVQALNPYVFCDSADSSDDCIRYLEVEFDGEAISPRTLLTSVPYAHVARRLYGGVMSADDGISIVDTLTDTVQIVTVGMAGDSAGMTAVTTDAGDTCSQIEIFSTRYGAGIALMADTTGETLCVMVTQTDSQAVIDLSTSTTSKATLLSRVHILSNRDTASIELTTPGSGFARLRTTQAGPQMVLHNDAKQDTLFKVSETGDVLAAGDIKSKTGFVFPDETVQTTAVTSGGSNWTVTDSVLYTNNFWGVARGEAGNVLYGDSANTMVNLGVACTTGTVGQNNLYSTVCGGKFNTASGSWATISGGDFNTASGTESTIGGGYAHATAGVLSTIGGGMWDTTYALYGGVFSGMDNLAGDDESDTAAFVGGGIFNEALAEYSSVSGGISNTASGIYSTVAGGANNTASGLRSAVGGGHRNTASDDDCFVGGGYYNAAGGISAVVGGGTFDTSKAVYGGVFSGYSNLAGDDADDTAAYVGGGYNNSATAKHATIGGGYGNTASWEHATVSGGYNNSSQGTIGGGYGNSAGNASATVGGGSENSASAYLSTISGGGLNSASTGSTVGGGWENTASGDYCVIGGGYSDTSKAVYGGVSAGYSNLAGDAADDTAAFVGGGYDNSATAKHATISGGASNSASGIYTTVGGGINNQASNSWSAVGGGRDNTASGDRSTVGGGYSNSASGYTSTVGGGRSNSASGYASAVSGGYDNTASNSYSTIGGGDDNTASGLYGTVGGGSRNSNAGDYSVIPGGYYDTLTSNADYTMAFGHEVYVNNSYRVVFFNSTYSGRLGINRDDHDGGISYPIHVGTSTANGNGAYLSAGGAWSDGSSRAFKENFQQLDGQEVLKRIEDLPMESWEYKGTGERHIWPCAEDFHEQFDVGVIKEDGTRDVQYLAAGDVAGVTLVGVQELYRMVKQNQTQASEIQELKARLAQVEALVETVLTNQGSGSEELASNR